MFGLVIRVALAWHLSGFYPTLDRCIAAQAHQAESVCTDRHGEPIWYTYSTAPHGLLLSKREDIALRVFNRRMAELSAASLRMIDAAVELRDARATSIQTT